MISPGERFLYPAVWIGLCWLIGTRSFDRVSVGGRVLTVSLIALLTCQILFLQINVGAVSNDLTALYSKIAIGGFSCGNVRDL